MDERGQVLTALAVEYSVNCIFRDSFQGKLFVNSSTCIEDPQSSQFRLDPDDCFLDLFSQFRFS